MYQVYLSTLFLRHITHARQKYHNNNPNFSFHTDLENIQEIKYHLIFIWGCQIFMPTILNIKTGVKRQTITLTDVVPVFWPSNIGTYTPIMDMDQILPELRVTEDQVRAELDFLRFIDQKQR